MSNRNACISISAAILLISSVEAGADVCPPPPSSVAPSLSVAVTYDKKTQLYKYRYTMKNELGSKIPLNYFGLLLNQAPKDAASPPNWTGKFISIDSSPFKFRWSTTVVSPSEASKITGDGTLSPPISAIKTGGSLSGFEITSSEAPGVVQYFAQGFTQIASGVPTPKNDEPVPNCPAWDFENSQLQKQVTGAVTGPSDPEIISVKLRARDESGTASCKPIQPKNPNGKIAVIINSTRTFDASTIDASSVVFGPGYATAVSSKLIPAGFGELPGIDERIDWEKSREDLGINDVDKSKSHPQNLLLVFDVATLDVQCNLDQSLFLRGKTDSGQQIVGAVSANVAGCSNKDFGKHKRHPFPFKWWISTHKGQ